MSPGISRFVRTSGPPSAAACRHSDPSAASAAPEAGIGSAAAAVTERRIVQAVVVLATADDEDAPSLHTGATGGLAARLGGNRCNRLVAHFSADCKSCPGARGTQARPLSPTDDDRVERGCIRL